MRPYWKGYLKLALVSCPIALHAACSSLERIAFRQINKATGNRLRQQLIDEETREPVAPEHKGRGYEIGKGHYLVIEDAELDAIKIASTHTIEIDRLVPRRQIDIDALRKREDKGVIELPGVVKHEQPEWEAIMTNQVMPKWKIDTIEAAIQALQRDKVPITASRIRKRTGPSVSLDEIRQHVAADRFTDRRK